MNDLEVHVTNADVVRRFEFEFKDRSNFDIADELTTEDFVHNLPYCALPAGWEGMKAVGHLVTGAAMDGSRSCGRPADRRSDRCPSAGRPHVPHLESLKVSA